MDTLDAPNRVQEVETLRRELADMRQSLSDARLEMHDVIHDTRNMFQLSASLISLQSRGKSEDVRSELGTADRRFRALAAVLGENQALRPGRIDLRGCLRRVADAMSAPDGEGIDVVSRTNTCPIEWRLGSRIALAVAETGFAAWASGHQGKRLSIEIRREDPMCCLDLRIDGAVRRPAIDLNRVRAIAAPQVQVESEHRPTQTIVRLSCRAA